MSLEAKVFLDKKQDEHFKEFGVYADVNSKIAEWMQEYADQQLILYGVIVRYFKCDKCGYKIQTANGSVILCQQYASYRTSGICAGSYDVNISREEFNAL